MYTRLARDMAEPSILVTLRAAATEGATRIVAILYLHSLGIHFRREIVGILVCRPRGFRRHDRTRELRPRLSRGTTSPRRRRPRRPATCRRSPDSWTSGTSVVAANLVGIKSVTPLAMVAGNPVRPNDVSGKFRLGANACEEPWPAPHRCGIETSGADPFGVRGSAFLERSRCRLEVAPR